jgi:hypothetical protein
LIHGTRKKQLASFTAVGNGMVHVDAEGHPISRETHCLHGQQRRLVVVTTGRMQGEKKKKL